MHLYLMGNGTTHTSAHLCDTFSGCAIVLGQANKCTAMDVIDIKSDDTDLPEDLWQDSQRPGAWMGAAIVYFSQLEKKEQAKRHKSRSRSPRPLDESSPAKLGQKKLDAAS